MADTGEIELHIKGMDCADCALTLERAVAQLDGVERVQISFSTATLQASGPAKPQDIIQRVEAMGYQVEKDMEASLSGEDRHKTSTALSGFVSFMLANRKTALALIGACLLIISAGLTLLPGGSWQSWMRPVLHLSVVILAGFPIARQGVRALRMGRQISIDLLMSVATVGALLIGESGEAATVIVLFAIGEALEGYAAERSRQSLRSLLALKPEDAMVLRPCLDCKEHIGVDGYTGGPCPFCEPHQVVIPAAQVRIGDMVIVRPGERIPVDGVIRSGVSSINQAAVTGESLPVDKSPGEPVFAGTTNGESVLEIEVTHLAQDSTISRIIHLVDQAQAQRAPVERFIDRFAAWYTPGVVALAIMIAVVPPLFFNAPFFDQPGEAHGWLYRALALLIVACPCALVISTPVTMVSALTALARRGVLVKGGVFLDALARIKIFAFDKTGTLTLGTPVVAQTYTLACPPGQARCSACDEMVALAAAVESSSEHPLAQAILAETQIRNLEHVYPRARIVQSLAGRGVQGYIGDELLTVSSHAYLHESDSGHLKEQKLLHQRATEAEAGGQTVMLVSKNGSVLGFVGVSDRARQSSLQALRQLKAIDPAIKTVMLTGDQSGAARKVAEAIGEIDEVRSGLLPDQKLAEVTRLQAQYGPVAMIGDGVNDAPALAAASVGIAMGGAGTAQAMDTAHIVLMQDDLTRLPDAVRTSRRTHRLIWQNIAFSLAIKAIFLALTLPGWATLWMAVFADMGASLLVTFNGMRILAGERRRA